MQSCTLCDQCLILLVFSLFSLIFFLLFGFISFRSPSHTHRLLKYFLFFLVKIFWLLVVCHSDILYEKNIHFFSICNVYGLFRWLLLLLSFQKFIIFNLWMMQLMFVVLLQLFGEILSHVFLWNGSIDLLICVRAQVTLNIWPLFWLARSLPLFFLF